MKCKGILAVAVIAAFACLAANLRGAIAIFTSQTFNTAPDVGDWATRSIAGAGNTFTDTATLDAAVQTNTAANISNALPTTATIPPSSQANARWNSTGLYLQTRPTGNGATLLKATLTNNFASAFMTLGISYDLNTF